MGFKGNKVWQALDDTGAPLVKNGKALIKYQLEQDHEYWVHQANIKPIGSEPLRGAKTKTKKKPVRPERRGDHGESMTDSPPPDAVCIYTDGASSGNPGPSGIGVLLTYGSHQKEISEFIGNATNNIAELEAIRRGLQELKSTERPVRIYTDSSYAHGLLTMGWKARKNIELVSSIQKLIRKFKDLKIIKVKGHAGHPENERADYLATSAIPK
jgi:ribonuclease HI